MANVEHSFIPFSQLHEYIDRQIDVGMLITLFCNYLWIMYMQNLLNSLANVEWKLDIIAMVIEMSPKKQISTRAALSTIQELSLISEEWVIFYVYNINLVICVSNICFRI